MRIELMDYQADAVEQVLGRLATARKDFHERGDRFALSLTATTGAGKTVMASAVIEALLFGNDDFNFDPDPGAVVLWFTDDPSLNDQTRLKLINAVGDRVTSIQVIENTFQQPKLTRGTVYFLNAQKLSRTSILGKDPSTEDAEGDVLPTMARPDMRPNNLWQTVRNTIEDDQLTLYLILDEAHRGMTTDSEKSTIVAKLINGTGTAGGLPVPIVWGISATVERFERAMSAVTDRIKYPAIIVDSARVQESGLLKDDIRMRFPDEAGVFYTTLLREATQKVKESTRAWREYAEREALPPDEHVVPLLVVQVPNTPSDELLREAFDTIIGEWPDLPADAMANVFGEHSAIQLGGHHVPYVTPQSVQGRRNIRVLFAKDAISTGWDCPRAEVLISFRSAQDRTHITQLLGRMVRTPLARRVPGDDRLNSVECLLPYFSQPTAEEVGYVLLGKRADGEDGSGGSGGGEGRRVLFKPIDMNVNPAIPQSVWDAFDALPSQSLPRRGASPVARLAAFAQALAFDRLRSGARAEAYAELFKALNGLREQYRDEVDAAERGVREMKGATVAASLRTGQVTTAEGFSLVADSRAISADFKAAGRVLTPDLAKAYAGHIAVADEDDDGLLNARAVVAALAQVDGVRTRLDFEANSLFKRWHAEHRVAIMGLSDERRAAYDRIVAMSPTPQPLHIRRPKVRAEETEDASGKVPTRRHHLMSDEDGDFPVGSLNDWEVAVLDAEMAREDFKAWYRNPGRASEDSLAIAYEDTNGNWRRMCPDFVFFSGKDDDIKVSIVDPHGYHLRDALPKLRGLAKFAEQHEGELHRIESVAEMKDKKLRVLNLKDPAVRSAVAQAVDAEKLYLSSAAADYR